MGVSFDSLVLPLAFSVCSYSATNAHIHDVQLEKENLKICNAKPVNCYFKIKIKRSVYPYWWQTMHMYVGERNWNGNYGTGPRHLIQTFVSVSFHNLSKLFIFLQASTRCYEYFSFYLYEIAVSKAKRSRFMWLRGSWVSEWIKRNTAFDARKK